MFTFEFFVEGPPVTVNTREHGKRGRKNYQSWIRAVRLAAADCWPSDKPVTNSTAVTVHITSYFSMAPTDVDNIIKPILDALNGVVYVDDMQVQKVISEKVDLKLGVAFDNLSEVASEALALDEVLVIQAHWQED